MHLIQGQRAAQGSRATRKLARIKAKLGNFQLTLLEDTRAEKAAVRAHVFQASGSMYVNPMDPTMGRIEEGCKVTTRGQARMELSSKAKSYKGNRSIWPTECRKKASLSVTCYGPWTRSSTCEATSTSEHRDAGWTIRRTTTQEARLKITITVKITAGYRVIS